MGGFSGLTIARRALMAQQMALEVAGHNIANANTEGYSRQRVRMVSSPPDITAWGSKGTGVDIASIEQVRDYFLDTQLRNETNLFGRYSELEQLLSRAELFFNEPSDTGLNAMMDSFWARWQDLATMPEEQTVRNNLIQQSVIMSDTFNKLNSQLEQLRLDIDDVMRSYITEINSITSSIASLNTNIKYLESRSFKANDLRDERNVMLKELAEFIDFTISENEDGTISIATAGSTLVDNTGAHEISYSYDSTGHVVPVWDDTNAPITINGGKMKGLLDARDIKIKEYIDRLDALAQSIIKEVNRQHAKGYSLTAFSTLTSEHAVDDQTVPISSDLSGLDFYDEIQDGAFKITVMDSSGSVVEEKAITITTGAGGTSLDDLIAEIDKTYAGGMAHLNASTTAEGRLVISADSGYTFFINEDTSNVLLALGINTFFTGTDSSDISVNSVISNDAGKINAGLTNAVGDGSNALLISQLKDARFMENNSATFTDYYASTLGNIGVDKNQATNFKNSQQVLLDEINNAIEQISGVSLDEEAMNIIRYQQAFAAAAQFLSAVDDMLTMLINTFS